MIPDANAAEHTRQRLQLHYAPRRSKGNYNADFREGAFPALVRRAILIKCRESGSILISISWAKQLIGGQTAIQVATVSTRRISLEPAKFQPCGANNLGQRSGLRVLVFLLL